MIEYFIFKLGFSNSKKRYNENDQAGVYSSSEENL